ncbi:MAG: NAD-dependent epimerase/dehydratase family protein, partial [Candidatus Nanohaloarchaea archaeon]
MKVLVLGSEGYIGSAATRKFLEEGHEVVEVDREREPGTDIACGEDVEGLPGDVDAVLNATGVSCVDWLEKDIPEGQDYLDALEKLARKYEDVKFVHLSSLAALGLEGEYSGEPDPVLPYSRFKRETEKVVREFENSTVIRPAHVFSPGKPPGLLEVLPGPLVPVSENYTAAVRREKLVEVISSALAADREVLD